MGGFLGRTLGRPPAGPESLDRGERMFDAGSVLTGRQDIIGDLARLRMRFLGSAPTDDRLFDELELLAASAVQLGMSFSIVGKASGISRERIEVVVDSQPTVVQRVAAAYERQAGGVLCRRVDHA